MNEIQPLISLLTGKFGWLPTLFAWLSALSMALGFVQKRIQDFNEKKLEHFAQSTNPDDDLFLTALLSAPWYRLAAFVAGFLNFWLPTLSDYNREKNKYAVVLRAIQGTTGTDPLAPIQNSELKTKN